MSRSSGDETRMDSGFDSGLVSGRKGGVILDADGYFTPRAAIVAWIGTAVLIVGAFSLIMWGWPLPLDGSGHTVVPMSAIDTPASGHSGSAATGVVDKQMSGRFEVGKDGKLLRPSDAPIPMQPLLPAAALEETPEGMEAFSRYVLNLIPYMWMSGNTEPLENISLPDCSWCQDVMRRTNERIEKGGWVEDVKVEVTSLSVPFTIQGHEHTWHIDLQYKQTPLTSFDGSKLIEVPEYNGVLSIQAVYSDGRWKILEAGDL